MYLEIHIGAKGLKAAINCTDLLFKKNTTKDDHKKGKKTHLDMVVIQNIDVLIQVAPTDKFLWKWPETFLFNL